MPSEKAIGVFDSGLGGLTAVKELSSILPNENIIYLGDTARIPYGSRSKETVTKFALADLNFILKHDVKAVLVACGTISSVALDALRQVSPVPVTGVVNPASVEAVKTTKNGKIAVLATSTTTKSGAYRREISKIAPEIEVFDKACPMFVHLVENGYFSPDKQATRLIVADYLEEVKESGADTVILGCTHYPILRPIIADYLGKGVNLIDSGSAAANVIADYLKNNNLLSEKNNGKREFYVTDEPSGFTALAELFLQSSVADKIKKTELEL